MQGVEGDRDPGVESKTNLHLRAEGEGTDHSLQLQTVETNFRLGEGRGEADRVPRAGSKAAGPILGVGGREAQLVPEAGRESPLLNLTNIPATSTNQSINTNQLIQDRNM